MPRISIGEFARSNGGILTCNCLCTRSRRSQVFAYKAELDQWLQKCAHTNSSSGEDRLAPEARPIRTVVARTSKLLFMASRQHDQIASINATVRRMVEREKARAGAVKT